jgi:hypothetical protein
MQESDDPVADAISGAAISLVAVGLQVRRHHLATPNKCQHDQPSSSG